MENNNYLTRELYESDKQATISKCEVIAADIRTEGARMKGDYNLINERFSNISTRLENIERSIEKFITRTSLILTGMTLLFTALQITFAIIALKK